MRVTCIALAVAACVGCGSSDSTPGAMHDAARPVAQLVVDRESLTPADVGVLVSAPSLKTISVAATEPFYRLAK